MIGSMRVTSLHPPAPGSEQARQAELSPNPFRWRRPLRKHVRWPRM